MPKGLKNFKKPYNLGLYIIKKYIRLFRVSYVYLMHFLNIFILFRLTESFAIYLANQFKNLKHLGSFHLWSREMNTSACLQAVSYINPAITFDENYNVQANRTRIIEKPSFGADKFKETSPYSCAWLNIHQPTYCFRSEVSLHFLIRCVKLRHSAFIF